MATVVAFHAHPDDEIILTGGTLAKLARAGHRTVIVVACDGHMEQFDDLIAPRLRELHSSAEVLGVNRVEHLGYADSGRGPILYPDPPGRTRFVRAPVDEAAGRLASILNQERPEILLSYDRNGGYGHPDHIRVHEVGALAAKEAGTPRVLNATIPRELFAGLTWPAHRLGYDATAISTGFTARAHITHRIDVGAFAPQRMNALAQHRTVLQSRGRFAKVAQTLRRIPAPIQTRVLRWEWFAENGFQRPASGTLDDIFTQPIEASAR